MRAPTFFGSIAPAPRTGERRIAVSNGRALTSIKEMGWSRQVFDEENMRHCKATWRSATRATRPPALEAAERPALLVESALGPLAVGHNGNLTNAHDLRQELLHRGVG